jgi:hypothetical protein
MMVMTIVIIFARWKERSTSKTPSMNGNPKLVSPTTHRRSKKIFWLPNSQRILLPELSRTHLLLKKIKRWRSH